MRFDLPETGNTISFKLADVVCPDKAGIIENLTEELSLTGKVLYLSDSGDQSDHYAIVEVAGLLSPVIVPLENVTMTADAEGVPTVKLSTR